MFGIKEKPKSEPLRLGQKVRDSITGYTGIAIGRTEWLYGCVRFTVQADALHDGKPIDSMCFDEEQLVLVEDAPQKTERTTNGPAPSVSQRPSPSR